MGPEGASDGMAEESPSGDEAAPSGAEIAAAHELLRALRVACAGQHTLEELADTTDVPTAVRYLRARGGKHTAALRMLQNSVHWRAQLGPPELRCRKCLADPLSHSLRWVGFAKSGEPVAYTCYGHAHNRFSGEANMEHVVWLLEHMSRRFDAIGTPLSKWIVIIDFEGFSLRDVNYFVSRGSTHVVTAHYPERLAKAVLYDAPRTFSTLWRAIRPTLDEKTQSKVQFISRRVDDGPEVWSHFATPELADWLAVEVEDNRRRRDSPKQYWEADDQLPKHDARGTASWLQDPHYQITYGEMCKRRYPRLIGAADTPSAATSV